MERAMASMTFDSITLLNELEESGLTRPQAQRVVTAIAQVDSTHKEAIAEVKEKSKDAVVNLEQTMKASFAEVDKRFAEVDKRFVQLEAKIDTGLRDVIIRFGVMIFTATGAIIAAIRYLPPAT